MPSAAPWVSPSALASPSLWLLPGPLLWPLLPHVGSPPSHGLLGAGVVAGKGRGLGWLTRLGLRRPKAAVASRRPFSADALAPRPALHPEPFPWPSLPPLSALVALADAAGDRGTRRSPGLVPLLLSLWQLPSSWLSLVLPPERALGQAARALPPRENTSASQRRNSPRRNRRKTYPHRRPYSRIR